MRKYVTDYKRGEDGYEYTKEWYKSHLDGENLKKQAVLLMGISAFVTLLFIVGLSLNNSGSRVFWILMPFVCAVFPVAYSWRGGIALYTFCRKESGKKHERSDGRGTASSKVIIPKERKGHMLRAEYEQSIRRINRSSWALLILTGGSLGADIVFILKNTEEILMGREIVFAVITLLMCLSAIFLTVRTGQIIKHFTKTK